MSGSSTNPWQPALDEKATSDLPSVPSMSRQDSGNNAWSDTSIHNAEPVITEQPVLVDAEEPESPGWDEDSIPSPTIQEMPATPIDTREHGQIVEDQHAWDDSQGQGQPPKTSPVPNLAYEEPTRQGEGWDLIDRAPLSETDQQESGVVKADGTILGRNSEEESAPPLPPRISTELPPPQPPRPSTVTDDIGNSSLTSTTSAAIQGQKKETYEIKKISWHDVTAAHNPRISPILVQNANGPCPLLALVNALVLSTPAGLETALVETLRSREQVSLGLLLDAVFDELMSGRRGDAAQGLPDVSDLYSFLITLHTGMNVNPRFFPPATTKSAADPRNSMSHVHPAEREAATPGTFEDTREMKLYSTFSVPLIHGWLPDRDSPAYLALKRTAQSYEDAQNIFFHEEVLEEKLHAEGLSFEEQATLEDIHTIKAFFSSAATQLTKFGLDTITTSLAPGAVAILFRNDHFSTLYRHPETQHLLQLVTDMGYARHEEVVWESLIDVNGENAEFFSGDFRLVGGPPASSVQTHSRSNAQSSVGRLDTGLNQQEGTRIVSHDNPSPTPLSPNTEQEDHDLALALQLQDEEEERHRNEIARRRREAELSQQYIEQQGHSTNIPVSQRGGHRGGQRGGQRGGSVRGRGGSGPIRGGSEPRPRVPPRRSNPPRPIDPEAGVDTPPPSYEAAATLAPYEPPTNHPAHPSSSPVISRTSTHGGDSGPHLRQTRSTLVQQIDSNRRRQGTSQGGTAETSGVATQEQGGRKDCMIM